MGKNSGLYAGYERFRVSAAHTPDDTGCGMLHVDMDAFFVIASPIQADEPTSSSVEEIEETFVDQDSLSNNYHSGCVIA